jgi:hypothetical protein
MKRVGVSLLLLLIFGQVAAAQDNRANEREKIANYLKNYLAEYNKRPYSLRNQFTDEFSALPEELEKSLRKTFPRHRFTVAKTYTSH